VVEVPVQVRVNEGNVSSGASQAAPGTPSSPSAAANEAGGAERQLSWTGSSVSVGGAGDGNSGGEFVSRYLADFEPVRCLGRGGFGVVFESKNRIDDNHYAVKRIRLPRVEGAKKKVLREVKFLAKLDHKNIVRYYNTWLEKPPLGWQECRDEWWRKATESSMASTDGIGGGITTTSMTSSRVPDPYESIGLRLPQKKNPDDSLSIVFEAGSTQGQNPVPVGEAASSSGGSSPSLDCDDAFAWSERRLARRRRKTTEGTEPDAAKKAEEEEEGYTYLYIVMQLCKKESLRDWLKSPPKCAIIRRRRALAMFHEICLGVEYVHGQGLIHRDLKPSNIFFSTDGTVKIGDFGLVTGQLEGENDEEEEENEALCVNSKSGNWQNQHTDRVGTELYMSPEQRGRKKYDHKVDIYSLGLILFELLVPLDTQMERARALSELRRQQFPNDFVGEEAFPLVKSMLLEEPFERPDASELLATDFMQTVLEEAEAVPPE